MEHHPEAAPHSAHPDSGENNGPSVEWFEVIFFQTTLVEPAPDGGENENDQQN